jgi:hypothetical protein
VYLQAYYREIAEHLGTTYGLEGGLVVDIGCGNGASMKTLCDAIPECRGLGIDPALDRDRQDLTGRVALIKGFFAPELIPEPPSLLVCRHVIEHISRPVEFLRTIGEVLSRFDSCPCFFEVRDLDWILENEVFSDFCYEHCNYYTTRSLRRTPEERASSRSLRPPHSGSSIGGQRLSPHPSPRQLWTRTTSPIRSTGCSRTLRLRSAQLSP